MKLKRLIRGLNSMDMMDQLLQIAANGSFHRVLDGFGLWEVSLPQVTKPPRRMRPGPVFSFCREEY